MMIARRLAEISWAMSALLSTTAPLLAGQTPRRELVVEAGRPLRLLIDQRTRVTKTGQPVVARLAEDVYSVDRVTIPAGTKVLGHVVRLGKVPPTTRVSAMLGGNFTPERPIELQFDAVVLGNGTTMPIQTVVKPGTAPADHEVAGAHDDGIVGHARQQVAREARRAAMSVRAPGKMARIGHYLVGRLPVHPRYLEAGAPLNAELVQPVHFGFAGPVAQAPDGTRPPPGTVLSGRLLTALDSASTERGAEVKAILTRPLLSSGNDVILPEGTIVSGKVTFVQPARRLRHNGQLRFLFGAMDVPGRSSETLAASLFATDARPGQHLEVDEEGGVKITNSKSRFIAPAVAGAVLALPVSQTEVSDEGLGALTTQANVAGNGIKGFAGWGLIGAGLSAISRPAAIAFGGYGLARAVYGNLLGKGQEVVFPVNTSMQIQLSPGVTGAP